MFLARTYGRSRYGQAADPKERTPSNMVDQALSDKQRVQKYVWGLPFAFQGVSYRMRVNSCQDVRYVCIKFGQSENPLTQQGFGFHLRERDPMRACLKSVSVFQIAEDSFSGSASKSKVVRDNFQILMSGIVFYGTKKAIVPGKTHLWRRVRYSVSISFVI